MKEIAIFGGTFSPVHSGHMEVAKAVIENGLAEEVWLMPCRRNPLKQPSGLLSDGERISQLRRAADYSNKTLGEERIRISELELNMEAPSYTSDTMRRLIELYPQFTFRIVAGADSYLNFEKWKDWEWLENNFRPILYPRPGYTLDIVRPSWTLLRGVNLNDISSSEIREKEGNEDFKKLWMPWLNDRYGD